MHIICPNDITYCIFIRYKRVYYVCLRQSKLVSSVFKSTYTHWPAYISETNVKLDNAIRERIIVISGTEILLIDFTLQL